MTETPGDRPTLSIVVLSWNTQELLVSCLASLEPLRGELPLQVIVLDNASHDGSADRVAQDFPWVELVRNERNDGYAIGNNLGAAHATGQYLLLLNSDTEVGAGVLTTLVSFLELHPGHGACAPKLVYPDGSVQHACMRFPRRMSAVFFDTVFDKWFPNNRELPRYFMRDFDHETSCDVEQPPGAAFLVRKSLWDELGGFDPDLWLFFNDVDLCKRIHDRGHQIAYVAEVSIVHHEGKSTSQFPEFGGMWHRNRLAYYRKHFGFTGGVLARLMTSVRGLEEIRRLSRMKAPPEARAELWRAVKGVWKS